MQTPKRRRLGAQDSTPGDGAGSASSAVSTSTRVLSEGELASITGGAPKTTGRAALECTTLVQPDFCYMRVFKPRGNEKPSKEWQMIKEYINSSKGFPTEERVDTIHNMYQRHVKPTIDYVDDETGKRITHPDWSSASISRYLTGSDGDPLATVVWCEESALEVVDVIRKNAKNETGDIDSETVTKFDKAIRLLMFINSTRLKMMKKDG